MNNLITKTLMTLLLASFCGKAICQTFIAGTGTSGNYPNLVMGHGAFLTADSGIDPVGSGYIRLTNGSSNQMGYAYINQTYPATTNFAIDFEFASWTRTSTLCADGITLFFFDGSTPASSFALGAGGGGLGYAGTDNAALNFAAAPALTGGYIGIGFDELGNFSSELYAGQQVPGYSPQTVSIRGKAADHTPYYTGNNVGPLIGYGTTLDYADTAHLTVRPADSVYYRKAHVEMNYDTSTGAYEVAVFLRISTTDTTMYPVIYPYPVGVPPSTLKIGFAASTGNLSGVHEVRNIRVVTSGLPLPLKLLSFSGSRKEHTDNLSWTTASEEKLSHFDVESSMDGNCFTAIGRVNAAGITALTHNYSFTCSNSDNNTWYRLKMVDNDGKYSYSKVVKLNGGAKIGRTSNGKVVLGNIYPVPFSKSLSVEIAANEEAGGVISLTDMTGRTLATTAPVSFSKGTDVYTLGGLQDLAGGVYLLRVTTTDGVTVVQTVMK